MSGHVISASNPVVSQRRRRSFAVIALSVLVVATASVGIVRAVSSDSSTANSPVTHRPAPSVSPATVASGSTAALSDVCSAPSNLDGAALLMMLASLPNGAAAQLTASLSPEAQQKIEQAALTAGLATGTRSTLGGIELRGALARLSTTDRQIVVTALSPSLRAAVGIEFDRSLFPMELQSSIGDVTGVPIPTCP